MINKEAYLEKKEMWEGYKADTIESQKNPIYEESYYDERIQEYEKVIKECEYKLDTHQMIENVRKTIIIKNDKKEMTNEKGEPLTEEQIRTLNRWKEDVIYHEENIVDNNRNLDEKETAPVNLVKSWIEQLTYHEKAKEEAEWYVGIFLGWTDKK